MYVAYKCFECGEVFIIPKSCLKKAKAGVNPLLCNFGHSRIVRIGQYNNLKSCMQQDKYGRTDLHEQRSLT